MARDWIWHHDFEKEKTVIQRVDAIAVFLNDDDNLVIRQENPMDSDDDHWIVVPRQMVSALLAAIHKEMKEPLMPPDAPGQVRLID